MALPFSPIRVFLVDDSLLALTIQKRMLATSPDIVIVGTARNGREALAQFSQARPKVICTDYHMPVMDGLDLVKEAMATYPRPILVVSSFVTPNDRSQVLPLLAAGAVDVFPKPSASDPFEETARQFVNKVRILSGVYVVGRRARLSALAAANAPVEVPTAATPAPPSQTPLVMPAADSTTVATVRRGKSIKLVAIGASTGGPQVLQTIFSGLPGNFPYPILCVQHISLGFLQGLVDWLNSQSRLHVKIAEEGEVATPGHVYFPREGGHLQIDRQGRLHISDEPPIDGHRPAVTVTFRSVAQSYGDAAVAILLTGMGSDGASGLQMMRSVGGITIAQDEASCVVFGMPQQAIKLGAAQLVLSPDEIVRTLVRMAISS